MLDGMTVREYVDWVAYFSVDWDKFRSKQSPAQMKANLGLVKAGKKRKK